MFRIRTGLTTARNCSGFFILFMTTVVVVLILYSLDIYNINDSHALSRERQPFQGERMSSAHVIEGRNATAGFTLVELDRKVKVTDRSGYKMAPTLIDGRLFPAGDLHDITLDLSIDRQIDSATVHPIPLLSNFKNPCWFELVNASYSYLDNSISQSREGSNKNGPHHKALHAMHLMLGARDNDNDGVTWRLRCLPYFYLAGVSKCGTTDLASILTKHPRVIQPLRKEIKYWNRIRYKENGSESHPFRHYVDFYDPIAERIRKRAAVDHLTVENYDSAITAEFTPNYLYSFGEWYKLQGNKDTREPRILIADLIHQLTPKAKIVLILRNPTTRLFSEYLFFRATNEKSHEEFRSLTQHAITLCNDCHRTSSPRICIYDHVVNSQTMPLRLRVGIYYLYIRDWLHVFPRDQIFITRLEDYAANRTRVANEIAEFLDIGPFHANNFGDNSVRNSRRGNTKKLGDMQSDMKTMIDDYYRPWNHKLAELLDDGRFLWQN